MLLLVLWVLVLHCVIVVSGIGVGCCCPPCLVWLHVAIGIVSVAVDAAMFPVLWVWVLHCECGH